MFVTAKLYLKLQMKHYRRMIFCSYCCQHEPRITFHLLSHLQCVQVPILTFQQLITQQRCIFDPMTGRAKMRLRGVYVKNGTQTPCRRFAYNSYRSKDKSNLLKLKSSYFGTLRIRIFHGVSTPTKCWISFSFIGVSELMKSRTKAKVT